MFSPPVDIFAWADAFNNFWHLVALIFGCTLSKVVARQRLGTAVDLSLACLRVSAKPIFSVALLCGLLVPVALAVVFTDQLQNQGLLALVGFPLGIWLWRGIHQNLDHGEGYWAAAIFIPIVWLVFGGIAYLPNI